MRTIYRWRVDTGLAFHQELAGFDAATDEDWSEWGGWEVRLELNDREGNLVFSFDSVAGEIGAITLDVDGTINFDIGSADTADLTPTHTVGRGKVKAQLEGTVYATDPLDPSEPYALALVKLVVREL